MHFLRGVSELFKYDMLLGAFVTCHLSRILAQKPSVNIDSKKLDFLYRET